jgi:nanoRNase/pAp phosphatase (c-di-AMP/oligoRNAs hydrolase)
MKLDLDLVEILETRGGERHAVFLHEYPDPDAIASALAHQLISAEHDVDVDIYYAGEISHQQNIAMVRLLSINTTRYNGAVELEPYSAAVLVDHQGNTVEEIVQDLQEADVPILLIVDHHEEQGLLEPEYRELHKVGATSTIYANYLEQGAVELDSGRKEHLMVATALVHGILSDTGSFVRAGPADFEAAAYLSRWRDTELLEQIMSQARSKHAMDIIYRALGNRIVRENYSIAGIGYLRAADRDAIPQAADFLLTEDNVHTAIVYGILQENGQDEILVGSLRTAKLTLDPGEFIKVVFGQSAEGRYFGGGKPSAGAFNIPVGFLSGDHDQQFRDLKWQAFDAQIKCKLFAQIGVEPEFL